MRAGVHTGRPQRIGGDWLGVDVNIAARVMDRAAHGGLIVSQATLGRITPDQWEPLGVRAKGAASGVHPRQPGCLLTWSCSGCAGCRRIPGENVASSSGAEGSSHSV